jgi:hypothetical protein
MPETYNFTLKGWRAIAALAVFASVIGLRAYSHVQTVDDAERHAIQTWLANEYQGTDAAGLMKRLAAAGEGLPVEPLPSKPVSVDIVSASARGTRHHAIVKVEITVNGGLPPDGQPIRYLELSRYSADDWKILYNSNAYRYNRALWR